MNDDIVDRLRDRGVGSNDHGDAKHLMLDAADVLLAERTVADDLARDLAFWKPNSSALARYREARQRL